MADFCLQKLSHYGHATVSMTDYPVSMRKIVKYHLASTPLKKGLDGLVRHAMLLGVLVEGYIAMKCVRYSDMLVRGFSREEEKEMEGLNEAVEAFCSRLMKLDRGRNKEVVEMSLLGLRMQALACV